MRLEVYLDGELAGTFEYGRDAMYVGGPGHALHRLVDATGTTRPAADYAGYGELVQRGVPPEWLEWAVRVVRIAAGDLEDPLAHQPHYAQVASAAMPGSMSSDCGRLGLGW